ncbi:MAG: MlaD family protein [Thermocrispum sp.]
MAGVVILSNTTTALPWEDHTVVKAEFEQVPGVNPNSSHVVTIAGVRVGRIADWRATDRGTALLTLDIEGRRKVFDNARAVLRPKNPLNEMQVELNPGGPPGKPLGDDGTIPLSRTQRPIQADEVLKHLDERSQQALTDLLIESDVALVRAPRQLPGGIRETNATLGELKPVMEALATRREQLSKLITALSRISTAAGANDARLAKLADSTQQTLGVLAANDDDLRDSLRHLPGLGDQLRDALGATQRLTAELDPTLDDLNAASGTLPKALRKLTDTVGSLGKAVDAARPFVAKTRPVVADLRPFSGDLNGALGDLRPITRTADRDTGIVERYLDDIAAFVYNTASVFGAGDTKETGIIRGHFVARLPDGGFLPGGHGGYAPERKDSFVEDGGK